LVIKEYKCRAAIMMGAGANVARDNNNTANRRKHVANNVKKKQIKAKYIKKNENENIK
jgi:hypothetical protein